MSKKEKINELRHQFDQSLSGETFKVIYSPDLVLTFKVFNNFNYNECVPAIELDKIQSKENSIFDQKLLYEISRNSFRHKLDVPWNTDSISEEEIISLFPQLKKNKNIFFDMVKGLDIKLKKLSKKLKKNYLDIVGSFSR
jgi:hypothetical protein